MPESFPIELTKQINDYTGTVVTFDGKIPESYEAPEGWLIPIIAELVLNCAEQKARNVTVQVNDRMLKVLDDVDHPNAGSVLETINRIKNSSKPGTQKQGTGGAGIFSIVRTLGDHGGEINYKLQEKRIVAEVTF